MMDNWTSVNLTAAHGNASKPSDQPSLLHAVTTGTLLSLITCGAIIGNVLVILSVCTNRKLRTITNRFVVSLATADLLVGVLVLPLAIKVEATERWSLGSIPCEVWIAFDVMLCTASILNLLCISVDRYWAITRPLKSITKRTTKLASTMIAVVWIAAAVVASPPLVGWKETGRDVTMECYLHQDPYYRLCAALVVFYIPLAVMLFIYARIFLITRARNTELYRPAKMMKKINRKEHASKPTATVNGCANVEWNARPGLPVMAADNSTTSNNDLSSNSSSSFKVNNITIRFKSDYRNDLSGSNYDETCDGTKQVSQDDRQKRHQLTIQRSSSTPCDLHNLSSVQPLSKSTSRLDKLLRVAPRISGGKDRTIRKVVRRETKTAKTLAIVVGCFIVCWTPFFVVYLLDVLCCRFNELSWSVVTWLGYFNSVINPFIYAFYNRDFRKSFWNLTFGQCISV